MPQLQEPFGGANLNAGQRAWNEVMSSVRVPVEWLLGNIKNYFKSIDSKKNLKIQLSAIGKLYLVCSLMQNARTCLYGSTTSKTFEFDFPSQG